MKGELLDPEEGSSCFLVDKGATTRDTLNLKCVYVILKRIDHMMIFLSSCKVCNVAQAIYIYIYIYFFFIFKRLVIEMIQTALKFYVTAVKICVEIENEGKNATNPV